jgi:hypothetical protein
MQGSHCRQRAVPLPDRPPLVATILGVDVRPLVSGTHRDVVAGHMSNETRGPGFLHWALLATCFIAIAALAWMENT